MRTRGFTLVELLMVIVITGILASVLTVFLRPAIDSYFDSRRRAELSDSADTALRRMAQDIRSAVPNSLVVLQNGTCFQLVPTITGGRYRMARDVTTASSNASAWVDTSIATTAFDVFNRMTTMPAVNDWVVINNQNGGDVYSGSNRAQITSVTTPPPIGGTAVGQARIGINSTQLSYGYDGGRFVVVRNTAQSVFYSCVNNALYRTVALFGADRAATCALTSNNSIVANNVQSCAFTYDPTQGATQQSGFIQMQLNLVSQGDSVTLIHGVHVENAP